MLFYYFVEKQLYMLVVHKQRHIKMVHYLPKCYSLHDVLAIVSVGVTPRIFPTFKIAQKQEEVESSVLQCW